MEALNNSLSRTWKAGDYNHQKLRDSYTVPMTVNQGFIVPYLRGDGRFEQLLYFFPHLNTELIDSVGIAAR